MAQNMYEISYEHFDTNFIRKMNTYTFNNRKLSRQTINGFYDINSSFENPSQGKIRIAIDILPKVMEATIVSNGQATYMSSGSVSRGDRFLKISEFWMS